MLSVNCRSGWFDGETDKDGGATKVDCLGEALLKCTTGGALGFFGSTRISYSGYNDELAKGFIDAMFPDFNPALGNAKPEVRLGKILNLGKNYMKASYPSGTITKIEYEQFCLLGDPASKIGLKKCTPRRCGGCDCLSILFIFGLLSYCSTKRFVTRKKKQQ